MFDDLDDDELDFMDIPKEEEDDEPKPQGQTVGEVRHFFTRCTRSRETNPVHDSINIYSC